LHGAIKVNELKGANSSLRLNFFFCLKNFFFSSCEQRVFFRELHKANVENKLKTSKKHSKPQKRVPGEAQVGNEEKKCFARVVVASERPDRVSPGQRMFEKQ
jgi:hypothetical protein